ncbi:MAG: bifunctional diaminohydroxyphosphoribosylaminopyrimidine deaminase/5-amino-6-(5-phosphoribosylamino)uracil reductase RibD [SAR324 cluster bacterium]|nr:bifunctional diaminohydroxyphosphoribosylaminopyrimidine deaminase/5-amino-6-(5-phosphoribosylamino)uracil reductase RibD [SAR324 cluster bacterium]
MNSNKSGYFTDELKISLMKRAIELAQKGIGLVEPNPLVGAVIALPDGKIISEGWHEKYQSNHAEAVALSKIDKIPPQAALFVNLEPCAHSANNPPCSDLIIAKKITQVIYGCIDQNPLVNGAGVAKLNQAGVIIEESKITDECYNLNRVFFHHITSQKAYLAIKTATSLDGKIALLNSQSKWITNPKSRQKVQQLRAFYQAVAVGKNTLEIDNPHLNIKQVNAPRQPVKIIFSSSGEIATKLNFTDIGSQSIGKKIIIAGNNVTDKSKRYLDQHNIMLIQTAKRRPSIQEFLVELYKNKIFSVMLEGGQALFTSAIKENQVNYMHSFIAPKIMGSDALSSVGALGVSDINQLNKQWKLIKIDKYDDDVYLEYQNLSLAKNPKQCPPP